MCTLDDLMNLSILKVYIPARLLSIYFSVGKIFVGKYNYGHIMLCSYCLKYLLGSCYCLFTGLRTCTAYLLLAYITTPT